MNLLGNNINNKSLSTFEDPFKSDKITRIQFNIQKESWNNNNVSFKCDVHFNVNKTSGWHTIEANSFNELVELTENFIHSLDDKK